jgi:hypothetical protein
MTGAPIPAGNPPLYAPPTDCIIVTTTYIPGYRVIRVLGTTFGFIDGPEPADAGGAHGLGRGQMERKQPGGGLAAEMPRSP